MPAGMGYGPLAQIMALIGQPSEETKGAMGRQRGAERLRKGLRAARAGRSGRTLGVSPTGSNMRQVSRSAAKFIEGQGGAQAAEDEAFGTLYANKLRKARALAEQGDERAMAWLAQQQQLGRV